jgi:hypothetical protein
MVTALDRWRVSGSGLLCRGVLASYSLQSIVALTVYIGNHREKYKDILAEIDTDQREELPKWRKDKNKAAVL